MVWASSPDRVMLILPRPWRGEPMCAQKRTRRFSVAAAKKEWWKVCKGRHPVCRVGVEVRGGNPSHAVALSFSPSLADWPVSHTSTPVRRACLSDTRGMCTCAHGYARVSRVV
jgi:hypothetical protein